MIYNPYIVVPLASWAVAQVAKFAIAAIKGRIDFRNLYASGGMPSVHSAVVMSLTTTSFLQDGPGSHLFGFVLIVSLVVIYDSMGVRRSTGEQGLVLNLLLDNLERNRFKLDVPPRRLREVLGHQPQEVVVGAITGIVLGALLNYERLGGLGTFFQGLPIRNELWAYIAVSLVLVLGGFIASWVLRRQFPKSKVMKQFRGRLFVAAETIGWLGLVAALFVYERASYLSWRLWPILILVVGAVWGFNIAMGPGKNLSAGLAAEATEIRKKKWFTMGRKSK